MFIKYLMDYFGSKQNFIAWSFSRLISVSMNELSMNFIAGIFSK